MVTAEHIKQFPGILWEEENAFYYVLDTKSMINLLFDYFRARKYYVDYSQLIPSSPKTAKKGAQKAQKQSILSLRNQELFDSYRSYLQGLRLSRSSVATYSHFIVLFLDFVKTMALTAMDNETVQRFVEQIVKTKKYGISTHRQLISAIKHFGARFGETNIEELELKRPSKNKRLPVVINQEEIILLLMATANLKHRTALALLYSSGLRISELLQLRPADLDIARRCIMIRNSKGRKDRYVMMAVHCIPLFQNYLVTYSPKNYFIEGAGGGKYSPVSVRSILKRSCKKAGIKKHITPHSLRHSYATHLIENGVGLRHVQELLGHSKPETTMIYTHVAQKDLLQIQSPFDHMIEKIHDADKKPGNISLSGKLLG